MRYAADTVSEGYRYTDTETNRETETKQTPIKERGKSERGKHGFEEKAEALALATAERSQAGRPPMEQCKQVVTHCSTLIDRQVELRRQGRRKNVRHGGKLCSRCLSCAPAAGRRYCRPCHAAYERDRRRTASLAAAAKGQTND